MEQIVLLTCQDQIENQIQHDQQGHGCSMNIFSLFQFAESLVKSGYSKVCVLHKGVEVMRAAGLLVVPTPEL